MSLSEASQRYHRVSMLLHWLMALCILFMIPFGFFMEDISPVSLRIQAYQFHKSLGLTVLVLSVIRIVWRLTHRPPAPVIMPAWQARAAHAVHMLLYGLMVGMPLTGWLYISTSSSSNYPTHYFGLFEVPKLPFFTGESRKAMHDLFSDTHEWFAIGAIALIAVHVLAALKHHFIDKDDTLTRMLPRRS